MKNLISTILLLLVTLPILAQERRLEQVEENLYNYKVYDNGKLQQNGWYKKIDGKYVATGLWRDSFGTMAVYDNGEFVWVKPKGSQKVSKQEIEIHRLRRRVAKLEQVLTSL